MLLSIEMCYMPNIIKTCKKHGDLTEDQVMKDHFGISFTLRCRQCRKEYADKNREKLREYSRKYEKTRPKREYKGKHAEKVRIISKEWRRKNKDLVNARVAADKAKDPERYRQWQRDWRKQNLEKCRLKDIVKKHNVSYEEYMEMINRQNGLCAICGLKETRKSRTKGELCRLVVDHDHKTDIIRELLCHNCNTGLGKFKDDINLLKKTILYLEKHACN